MKVGIFGNSYQPGKQAHIAELFNLLQEIGSEIWVEKHFFNFLSKHLAYTPKVMGLINTDIFPLEMAISLGGDGTFLKTAAWVGKQDIPILGINTGRLGFLADVSTDDIKSTIGEIAKGEYTIERRSLLHLTHPGRPVRNNNYALNEIAILKRDTSAMITIYAYINDAFLAEYLADGLLVSTPTGSTAYNLSAGGPIVVPQSRNFILNPINPHSLNIRPLVIPEDCKLRFRVESREKKFLISLDGRSETFPSGSEFEIEKAAHEIGLVKRKGHSFYKTIRNKLYWGSDIRHKSEN